MSPQFEEHSCSYKIICDVSTKNVLGAVDHVTGRLMKAGSTSTTENTRAISYSEIIAESKTKVGIGNYRSNKCPRS